MLRPETETEPHIETGDDPQSPPASSMRQHTLGGPIKVEGLGLLLGAPVHVSIEPADIDHGIVFERIDLDPPVRIPALLRMWFPGDDGRPSNLARPRLRPSNIACPHSPASASIMP